MLRRVIASEFVRAMTSGRTGPILTICEDQGGNPIEVVTKFAGGCEQGSVHLAREVVAACLAGDLGLPIPEPLIVEYQSAWASLIPDQQVRAKAQSGPPLAFGSKLAAPQWVAWRRDTQITGRMLPIAAAVFVFDALIQNPDRRWDNPNCLVNGDSIRIFDHELAFSHDQIALWKPPWMLGGLSFLETPGNHIFRVGLSKAVIDWEPVKAAWVALSDQQVAQYGAAVPMEWGVNVGSALCLIRDAKQAIDECLIEVQRVLK